MKLYWNFQWGRERGLREIPLVGEVSMVVF